MCLKIAIRNVFRNKVRTIITLLAITFGCMSLILIGGFIHDALTTYRDSIIYSRLGHIQIAKKGFFKEGTIKPFDYMIDNPEELREALDSLDHIERITPRLQFVGLLSKGETTFPFLAEGIDPAGEKSLSSYIEFEKGENLSKGDNYTIILGKGLARAIGADVGDDMIILTNTIEGGMNALDVKVKGIFYTSSKEYDDHFLRIPVRTAQYLLQTEKVQKFIVILDKTANLKKVTNRLDDFFVKNNLPLEYKTWFDLAEFYNKLVAVYERQLKVINIIIYIIVILSISNTMSMAIFERTREIGTIMALGAKRHEVLFLFILEGAVLGAIGSLLGIGGGIFFAHLISWIGIPMPPGPGISVGWIGKIAVVPAVVCISFFLCMISAVISSFYPAFKASRLNVAEALRYV